MLTYDLKVGYSCNNKCKHCVIADSNDKLINNNINADLTTEECLNLINENINKGIDKIVLTGGEVTLRKDFDILLKKCNDNNLFITIQTNGRRLYKKFVLNSIKNIDNIKFVVALHGAKAKTHDNITCIKGSFNETIKGISAIININKIVILKVVISKINAEELPYIVNVANELGVKYICFAFPHGQGNARKNFNDVIPKYSYLQPILEKIIENSKIYNINIEFEAIPFCIIYKHMHLVGELKYLKSSEICSQVHEDIFDWNKIRHSIKSKGANCKKCALYSICEGPWSEYTDAFGFDELKPIIVSSLQKERILNALHNIYAKGDLEIVNFNP